MKAAVLAHKYIVQNTAFHKLFLQLKSHHLLLGEQKESLCYYGFILWVECTF